MFVATTLHPYNDLEEAGCITFFFTRIRISDVTQVQNKSALTLFYFGSFPKKQVSLTCSCLLSIVHTCPKLALIALRSPLTCLHKRSVRHITGSFLLSSRSMTKYLSSFDAPFGNQIIITGIL